MKVLFQFLTCVSVATSLAVGAVSGQQQVPQAVQQLPQAVQQLPQAVQQLPKSQLVQGTVPVETPTVAPVTKQEPVTQDSENQITQEGKIRFSFQDQDWDFVVPWIAEQAGFQLQHVEDWPEGVFSLQDGDEYTVIEALDQLNHALRLLKPEPYTLIRNRRMLVLVKANGNNYPDELIEIVPVEDLNNRGKYEIMDSRFNLGELNGDIMFAELGQLVSENFRNKFALFPSSNTLSARGTGEQLRAMRDLIADANRIMEENKRDLLIYELKYQDAETFIAVAGPQLGIASGQNGNADETLSITAEPLSNRLFVSGTRKMRDLFSDIAKKIDTDPNSSDEMVTVDAPYFQKYAVIGDPKLAFNLLQNVLSDSDAKMEQDELTGAIVVLARKAEHERTAAALGVLGSNLGDEFAIIKLEKIDAADALQVLQTVFQQNTLTDDAAAKGPQLIADSYAQKIIVSGTVQEVARTRAMLKELDSEYEDPTPPGPRSPVVMIPIDQADQDKLLPMLSDIIGSTNRPNKFRVILPEDRGTINDRIRRGEFVDPEANIPDPTDSLIIPETRTMPKARSPESEPDGREDRRGASRSRSLEQWMFVGSQMLGIDSGIQSILVLQDDDDTKPAINLRDPEYKPAPKVASEPGAPIEFSFKGGYLTIRSKDLDALDDIDSAIRQFLGEEASIQLPVFYEFRYRSAVEIKEMLEEFYGMGGGDSGGGGGGLMGGMMNNMLGGAGDLLGGLLDTGGGGGGGGELEGDVSFGLDVRFNTMWIRGATDNDLAEINQLIDMWDRPEGLVKPELAGEFRSIDVIHRDAEELVEIITKQIPELIRDPTAEKAAGGAQNNQMQEMMKAMQALSGGGKKSASSTDVEAKKPKATLAVDPMTNQLFVTGPSFIYDEVLKRVVALDVPDLTKPMTSVPIPAELGSLEDLFSILEQQYPKMIIREDGEQDPARRNSSTANATPGSGDPTADAAAQRAQQMMGAMNNAMMRAQQQGGGGRGGNTGGRGGTTGGRGGSTGGRGGGGGRGGR